MLDTAELVSWVHKTVCDDRITQGTQGEPQSLSNLITYHLVPRGQFWFTWLVLRLGPGEVKGEEDATKFPSFLPVLDWKTEVIRVRDWVYQGMALRLINCLKESTSFTSWNIPLWISGALSQAGTFDLPALVVARVEWWSLWFMVLWEASPTCFPVSLNSVLILITKHLQCQPWVHNYDSQRKCPWYFPCSYPSVLPLGSHRNLVLSFL